MHMKSLIRTSLLALILVFPTAASAVYDQTITTTYNFGLGSFPGGFTTGTACYGGGIGCIAAIILYLINSVLVPLLFAVSFIVFLYGVAKAYIFSHGDSAEIGKGHQLILWGLIGFVVMVSLWGLVNVVANTFGLWGSRAPILPTSY